MDTIKPRSFPGNPSKPFASLGGKPQESRDNHSDGLPEPVVLYEARSKWDTFRLERKSFIPEDSPTAKEFYWLSRAKAGERPKGLSVRKSEMAGLVEAFQRILAENDGANRGGR